jgi:hypothetical protein
MRVLVGCTNPVRATHDLGKTLLWRKDVTRDVVTTLGSARAAIRDRPALTLLERDLRWAADFIREVREDTETRKTSIAVYAGGDMDPVEMDLMSAGANAVLRLPAGPEWDKRLSRLVQVAPREAVRVPVFVEVETGSSVRTTLGTSVNLSESGILIQSQALDLGSELTFAVRLPGAADPVRGRARVVRVGPEESFGLEFTEISGDCVELIRAFVTRAGF